MLRRLPDGSTEREQVSLTTGKDGTMSTLRLGEEQAFHDRQARERAACLTDPEHLRFDDDDYLDHESWIRPALARLGCVAGLRVLDFGCGHGMAAVVLARRGACVTGCDLSGAYLSEARRGQQANGVVVHWVQANGEQLPFADASFDRIWGNAILHHLDLNRAGQEIHRVLRPGGVAVFCEPWGENPLLEWARRSLPYRGKARTPDERPLRARDLPLLRAWFPELEVEGFQLLSMARRVLGPGRVSSALAWCDARLLRTVPALSRFCRYVVLTLRR
jgi:SAM-dependent methyltransferase